MKASPVDPRSKLPVDHPEYLYPPSKNPYYSKIQALTKKAQRPLAFWDQEAESHKDHWPSLFHEGSQTARPLHVEVGCNAGHVILEEATRRTQELFIGVDWKIKMITWAAEKAYKRNLRNLLFVRAHANRLSYLFGDSSIDTLSIFFPDPWPTLSQHKNRWVTERRLKMVAPALKPGALLWIKTDHPEYFEWMLQAVSACPELFEIESLTRDKFQGHPDPQSLTIPEVTLFERLFIKDQLPIRELKARRK